MELSPTFSQIAEKIHHRRQEVCAWFDARAKQTRPSFYSSVDLRDSGFKVAPVDCNLFPAGFNNLCPNDLETAPGMFSKHLEARLGKKPGRLILLPEAHTSNTFYLENLATLMDILKRAKIEVILGWLKDWPVAELKAASGRVLTPTILDWNSPHFKEADAVLINNDFSSGYPKEFDQITVPCLPSYKLGWHSRKKSTHFKYYNQIAKDFAEMIGFDPWLISVATEEVDHIDFNEGVGMDRLAEQVNQMLLRLKSDYASRKIDKKPFVFIKSNSGTYGMGIMVVHDASEIATVNRRTKNKMSVGKNRSQISSVVIQEGITTAVHVNGKSAEPCIYQLGTDPIGGFLRANLERGDEENLNASGMVFEKFCMSDLREPKRLERLEEIPSLEWIYGSVARISALATGHEFNEKGIDQS